MFEKKYGSQGLERCYSVVQTSDGGYALAGITSSIGAGDYDMWLVKIDASGNMEWNQTYGGTEAESCLSVVQTSDGGYILAGSTNPTNTNDDVYLIKTDASGNSMWTKSYGGGNDDYGQSVQQTSDGGYIIAGWTRQWEPKTARQNRTLGGVGHETCDL